MKAAGGPSTRLFRSGDPRMQMARIYVSPVVIQC